MEKEKTKGRIKKEGRVRVTKEVTKEGRNQGSKLVVKGELKMWI